MQRRSVIVYNKRGNEYIFRSLRDTAKELGVSVTTVRHRIADGLFIFVNGRIPVRVRFADDED